LPLISAASLESTSDALTTCTCAEHHPDFLWQRKGTSKLDQLHKYLIGKDSSRSQPPAHYQLLEKNTTHLINHLSHWRESTLQEITQAAEITTQRLLPSSVAPEPHTPSRGMFITVEVSQPRGEHVSECPGTVRSHCRVEMGQGESFMGFPRQFTALFIHKN
jgi:hypothetical protein